MQPQLKQLSVLGRGGFHKLAYAEWGPPRAERTVLCLHGVSRTGRDFDMLAAALAGADVRVVVPDLPGHGRSEWLESPAHYTDRAYTRAMSTLIARLDVEQVDWVGTSFGAHIGMLMASEYGTPVRRLVLNDFGALVSAAALRRVGSYLKRSWRFTSIDEVDAHLREVHAPFGKLSDAQWRHLAEHSAVPDDAGGFRFRFDPGIGLRFALPIWLDVELWHVWDQIECPVLILRGEHSDLLARSTVDAMLKRGPAARSGNVAAFEFPDCGHAPALMDGAQIATIKDYLT
ncbi:alpha/beta hydrolase fold protein [Caballeronia choica]|uniref:Alpha/beta hydrolase fold protein n=1 Tax=Caballeronia choica TaxID=326476 RepID=A0A158L3P2_9BURK|nr:alpha/beta hydrolase [Caballeronia choica]SAL87942.1 alpha/beta hydrolase fold protein [Caballeronia choica]